MFKGIEELSKHGRITGSRPRKNKGTQCDKPRCLLIPEGMTEKIRL
jgi:hypothetical protein